MSGPTAVATCQKCGKTVPRAQSYFTLEGDVLCADCNRFYEAGARVERWREDATERAQSGALLGGSVGRHILVIPMVLVGLGAFDP